MIFNVKWSVGLSLLHEGRNGVLLATFDAMYSSRFCGIKAAEYFGNQSLSGWRRGCGQCIFLAGNDLVTKQNFVETLVRRLFHSASDSTGFPNSDPLNISFIVDDSDRIAMQTSAARQAEAESLLRTWVSNIAREFPQVYLIFHSY